jgi:hypothetical protein
MNEDDINCRMKRCLDCREWKPLDEFYLRKRGAGMGRLCYCKPCMAARWRAREDKRKLKYEGTAFAHRLPEETAVDYALHAFAFWPKIQLVELAISQAPPKLIPIVKRELFAMAQAA